jgi:hypothetical protein
MSSLKKHQGTDSRALGSIWEIGLDLADIYRRCRCI